MTYSYNSIMRGMTVSFMDVRMSQQRGSQSPPCAMGYDSHVQSRHTDMHYLSIADTHTSYTISTPGTSGNYASRSSIQHDDCTPASIAMNAQAHEQSGEEGPFLTRLIRKPLPPACFSASIHACLL